MYCFQALSRYHFINCKSSKILLTGTKKFDHITPVLATLHCRIVVFRIDFKISLFYFKAVNDLALAYVSNLLTLNALSRVLRSSNKLLLVLPWSNF